MSRGNERRGTAARVREGEGERGGERGRGPGGREGEGGRGTAAGVAFTAGPGRGNCVVAGPSLGAATARNLWELRPHAVYGRCDGALRPHAILRPHALTPAVSATSVPRAHCHLLPRWSGACVCAGRLLFRYHPIRQRQQGLLHEPPLPQRRIISGRPLLRQRAVCRPGG